MDVGCQINKESSEKAHLCEDPIKNNDTVLRDSLLINEDNTPLNVAGNEIGDLDPEEETCQRPNLSKRVAEIIKLARRRRGRQQNNKAVAKRALKLIKHSKRRPGRPPCN